MTEILSAEQPCILCGMLLLIVTWHRDDLTGEERTERTPITHNDEECRDMATLYQEIWPNASRAGL